MANVLITYGDNRFKESLVRLSRQAKKIGIFDRIIKYSPKDLPSYIKSSPLFAFDKGGGYWLWKPYIILKTLKESQNGDVIYYIDSGCRLNAKSAEWYMYQNEIKKFDAIFFQYRSEVDYGWEKICSSAPNNSTRIKHWTKPLTMEYFSRYLGSDSFGDYDKIMGGFCIIKKGERNSIIDEWLKISLFHPELVMDPFGEELNRLPDTFNLHRHDQSIITPLVYFYKEKQNILVLPETSESQRETAAVVAERYRVGKMPFTLYLKYKIYTLIYGYK